MSEALKSPFPWFGGKSRVAAQVWQRFGDCPNYIEPFAGSLAVLLARPTPPRYETVNDLDCNLVNFWRAVRADPEAVAYYADWPVMEADLHSRHAWLIQTTRHRARRIISKPDYYDAKAAGWWCWGCCLWIGGGWCSKSVVLKDGSTEKRRPTRGDRDTGIVTFQKVPYLSSIGVGINKSSATRRKKPELDHLKGLLVAEGAGLEWLTALSERLRPVRVLCGDWKRALTPALTTKLIQPVAVFLDPPYRHEGRDNTLYAQESDISAHVREWATENGDNPAFRIALCGYEGDHIMPDTWECLPWKTPGGYANIGTCGTGVANSHRERIWFSPNCEKAVKAQGSLFGGTDQ